MTSISKDFIHSDLDQLIDFVCPLVIVAEFTYRPEIVRSFREKFDLLDFIMHENLRRQAF
jgi:hypothetical protein